MKRDAAGIPFHSPAAPSVEIGFRLQFDAETPTDVLLDTLRQCLDLGTGGTAMVDQDQRLLRVYPTGPSRKPFQPPLSMSQPAASFSRPSACG